MLSTNKLKNSVGINSRYSANKITNVQAPSIYKTKRKRTQNCIVIKLSSVVALRKAVLGIVQVVI